MTDVDIDLANRNSALEVLHCIRASRLDKEQLVPHNTGVYFQRIPFDPVNNLSTVDYKSAESRGYFKIDFLNVHLYSKIANDEHLDRLLNTEPVWELLCEEEICNQLIHVNGYHLLMAQLKPRSVEQLAIVLALIRPGKKHLINQCVTHGFDSIASEVWNVSDSEAYSFKHSHAVSYAVLVVVNLNLICEELVSQNG